MNDKLCISGMSVGRHLRKSKMNNRLYYQIPSERLNEAKERRRNTIITALLFVIVMCLFICTAVQFWKDGIESGEIAVIRNK